MGKTCRIRYEENRACDISDIVEVVADESANDNAGD